MKKTRRGYDREFKISVVSELEGGRPLAQIAREYIAKARTLGASEMFCDLIGIGATKLNSALLVAALGDGAPLKIPEGYADLDHLAQKVIKDRLAKDDVKGGWMLDGFPRTMPKAEALDKILPALGQKIDIVLKIDVPDAEPGQTRDRQADVQVRRHLPRHFQ